MLVQSVCFMKPGVHTVKNSAPPCFCVPQRYTCMHEDIVLTPMMKQFLELKAKHPDAVMLFRCGDFYETYSTDAVLASEILGITLTKRANGKGKTIEMAGFPHHAQETGETRYHRIGNAGRIH